MNIRSVVLLAILSALWLSGLLSQLHSTDAAMRYLVLSLGIVAVAVWLMPVRAPARRKFRDRKNPPDRS